MINMIRLKLKGKWCSIFEFIYRPLTRPWFGKFPRNYIWFREKHFYIDEKYMFDGNK